MFLALILASALASGHERQVIKIGDKKYLFTVGFLNEPTYVDDKSGLDVQVVQVSPLNALDATAEGAKPVIGLENTLKVEITAGDKKITLPLEATWKDPGAYEVVFFPTLETTYTFKLIGKINNLSVTIPFSCQPGDHEGTSNNQTTPLSDEVIRLNQLGGFGCPQPREGIQFPEHSFSDVELTKKVEDNVIQDLASQNSHYALAALIISMIALVLIMWTMVKFNALRAAHSKKPAHA